LPGLHAWHAAALVAPWLGLALPAGHAADLLLVLPATHQWPASHAPTHCALVCPGASPNRPATQSSGSVAPLTQNEPTEHIAHSSTDAALAFPHQVPAVWCD
jgi:hypothetical protein